MKQLDEVDMRMTISEELSVYGRLRKIFRWKAVEDIGIPGFQSKKLGVRKKPKKPSKLRKKTIKKTVPKKNRLNRLFFLLKFSVWFGFGLRNRKPEKPQPNRTGSV